ncbi:HAD-IA family hydrolase [Glaciihabitans sp. UYNi722]|uniref:HAD-IA family hydrolase n=1 Tax=Glaciihabitans sp. UYNi722 TaxID=3156344 RepID=UPI003393B416
MEHLATRNWLINVRGVLFNMDGTLVDSSAVVEALWGAFARKYDLDIGELLDYSHGRQTRDTVFRFLPDDLDPHAAAIEFQDEELFRLDGIREIGGAAAFVHEMISRVPVAIVTSAARQLALRRLRAAGVGVPSLVIAAEDVKKGKPDPEGYIIAAARLGIRIEDCVIFEDADAGIDAAIASGGRVVVVGQRARVRNGIASVADFRDLSVLGNRDTDTVEIDY